MRVAIAGKGGVGKTTLAATLARVLARRGRAVLAFDFDVNPGLGLALAPLTGDGRLPPRAVERKEGSQYGWRLRAGLSPAEVVERYAAHGADGVRFLALGAIDRAAHDLHTTHMAVREVAAGFDDPGWDVVVDMEAGTKDVFDGTYVPFADPLLAVTDGSPVANLTCRRLVAIAAARSGPRAALLLNRALDALVPPATALAGELGVPFLGVVPDDENVRLADVDGVAPIDRDRASPAVQAVEQLADNLAELSREVAR